MGYSATIGPIQATCIFVHDRMLLDEIDRWLFVLDMEDLIFIDKGYLVSVLNSIIKANPDLVDDATKLLKDVLQYEAEEFMIWHDPDRKLGRDE